MITFKIGILGTGAIAKTITDTIEKLEGFSVYAIASRDAKKANEFAFANKIPVSYGSYEELVADPEVELVYVATPHSEHAENAKLCINAGKPVLVEKPFSYNKATASEVIKLAREKHVFCAEAMWIRYMPMMRLTADLIKQEVIGKPQTITANLGYDLRGKERIVKPELCGGALLDLGVYPLTAICMLFNALPVTMASTCTKLDTGVDAINTVNLIFQGGRVGTAVSTMLYKSDNNAVVYGTKGRIEIDNINNPEAVRIYNNAGEIVQTIYPPEGQISGYEYEFISARKAIICGEIEAPEAPLNDSFAIISICDGLRTAWKESYPLKGEDEIAKGIQRRPAPGAAPAKPTENA